MQHAKMVTIKTEIIVNFLVCILFLVYSAADIIDDQYIGCYKDNGTVHDLGDEITSDSMTISLCIEHCKSRSKTYAGTQNGGTCFCGDTYGTYGLGSGCNTSCSGNASYYCGGILRNSIYAVCPLGRYGTSCSTECHCAMEAPCFLANGTCLHGCADGWNETHCNGTAVPASALSYQGCYNDATNNGFRLLFEDQNRNSIQLCMDRCRITFGLYVGLQYGYQCFCGNSSYKSKGNTTKCGTDCPSLSTKCNCPGAPADRCGGANANDVYSACQSGYYGILCSHQCHCLDGSNCTMEDGACPHGDCASGWTGMSCNIRNCSDDNGDCTGEYEICAYLKTGEGKERAVPRCTCKDGYTRNREYENCTDVNECALDQSQNKCDPTSGQCINSAGSYNCKCFEGYANDESSKSCKDIDECELTQPKNKCESTSGKCINLVGSYNCTCFDGFANSDSFKACQDVNECELNQTEIECDPSSGQCINIAGSYNCDCFEGFANNGTSKACKAAGTGSGSGVIVGAIVGSLCAILLIAALLAFLYWRRRQSEKSSIGKANSGFSNTCKADMHTSIEVNAIWKIDKTEMRKEFKSVPMEADHPADYASSVELKEKNKYRNILPYNHNRVTLSVIGDDSFTDYINASFISTYRHMKVIASHGPQSATVNDFWRMVWEQDVAVIVMITRCIENGRQKCEQYWPDVMETKIYGSLKVLNVKEECFADYIIRKLRLACGTELRVIRQCHFLGWPDHDVPAHAYNLLKFRRKVLKYTREDKAIVIHCSAGVGRTGTYIAVDNLLCEAEDSSRVDVLKCLQGLRQQRMHLIQTEEQYIFVYLVIAEAYLTGETTLLCSDFMAKYASQSSLNQTAEKEYQALERMKTYLTDDDKYDALLPVNLNKNRDLAIVPGSRDRVYILTREKDRNDYINAVFCQSYQFKEAYIQTQLPLPDTVVDFWNMFADYNCQFAVVLDDITNPDFIPTQQLPMAFQHLTVYYKAEKPIMGGKSYDLFLVAKRKSQKSSPAEESIYMNTKDDVGKAITVAVISPNRSGAFDKQRILSLYNTMREKYSPEQQSRIPIVVMCKNGCTNSSVFICISNVMDMLECQQEVDIFEIVHNIRITRPQAIESLFLYAQLYALVLRRLQDSSEEAVNIGDTDEGAIYVNN